VSCYKLEAVLNFKHKSFSQMSSISQVSNSELDLLLLLLLLDLGLLDAPPALPPPHVVRLCAALGGICSVGQVIQIVPVWGGGAVHVVIPVAHSEFLVEARLVAAHVGNPATILITHVKYHAILLHICVEADGSVGAIKVKRDIWEVCPSLFLERVK